MATAFAGIFTLAVIGVGLFLVTSYVERRVLFGTSRTSTRVSSRLVPVIPTQEESERSPCR
jgi:hypothetical protein